MITVLTGDNSYEVAQEMRRIISAFEGEAERYEGAELSTSQLPDLLMGGTLFSQSRLVIISDLSANKSLWNEFEQWGERLSDDIQLVLVEPKPDKRTRTYKWLQKHATVKTHGLLKEPQLLQWLQTAARQRGIELKNEVARYLIMHTGTDQWQLSKELDKLALARRPISIDLIREFVPQNSESRVFDVLDAAFSGKSAVLDEHMATLRLYEEPYRFFGLLANQVVILAAASQAGGISSSQLASDMGVHPFVASKTQSLARMLGEERVRDIVTYVVRLDKDLKSTGGDPWLLIEATLRTLK